MIDDDGFAKRAAVGAAILVAHLVLVALLISTGVIKAPTLVPAVAVTFLQQEEEQPERPNIDRPILTPLHQVLVPAPEVVVDMEPNSAIIAATVAQTPPSPPATATPSSGGESVPEMSDVAYLVQPTPRYPLESRRTHEHGLVVLRVLIDASGHAESVQIYRSSGHPRLDQEARLAVARAVFKPFMDGGVARAAAAMVPIEFSLRASSS